MSKLFKLKEWLTVAEAAKHLSVVFGEEVAESDVLRFALDGRLRLSVYLAGSVRAWRGRISAYGDPTDAVQISNFATVQTEIGIRVSTTRILKVERYLVQLVGLCDLMMIGNERNFVDDKFRSFVGWSTGRSFNGEGAFLAIAGADGVYALQGSPDDKAIIPLPRMPWHPEGYIPAVGLPEDSSIVVRTDALRDLEESMTKAAENGEKSLGTTERETLLKLVIGMAIDGYGHDPAAAKSKIPKEIAGILAGLDMPVSDDTVRKYLKQATDLVLPAKPR